MRRNIALAAGAAVGAAAAFVLRRRRTVPGAAPPADTGAEELRRKLAEAKLTAAEEDDFEAAGMVPETTAPEEPRPPRDEFDAMRRRVHAEGRAAADEMRRRGEGDTQQ